MKNFLIGLAFVCTVLAVIIYFLLPGLNLPDTQEMKEKVFFFGMAFGAPLGWVLGFYVVGPWFQKTPGRRLFSVVSAMFAIVVMMLVLPNDTIIKWLGIAIIAVGTIWVVLGGHKEGEGGQGEERVKMLWFDNSFTKLDIKAGKAIKQYKKNYGYPANVVVVNPADYDKRARIQGVTIQTDKKIQQGFLYVTSQEDGGNNG